MTRFRILVLSVATLLAGLTVLAPPAYAQEQGPQAPANAVGAIVPITGTFSSGSFSGSLQVTHFAAQNGQIVANGTLSGTLTDSSGQILATISDVALTLPVTNLSASCTVLDITFSTVDLNLLGLMVHLDQGHLTITAQQGSQNQLRNLMCTIAHLLDAGGPLPALANLLNQMLAAL